jgi:hypothetical protein
MRAEPRTAARAVFAAAVAIMLASPAAAQRVTPADLLTRDLRGASDHPVVGRYQGAALLAQTVKAFDELSLPAGPAEGRTFAPANQKFTATVTAQGKITRTIYIAPPGRSALEVTTNFVDAVASKGFERVFA